MRVLLFHIPDYVYTIIIILYHTRVSVRTSVLTVQVLVPCAHIYLVRVYYFVHVQTEK